MFNVTVRDEVVVLGCNPENADMDNPRGEYYGTRFHLLATDEHGNRRREGSFETEEDAEAYFWAIAPPVEEWEETYPEYGSHAYEDYGQADEVAWERRMAEDLVFA